MAPHPLFFMGGQRLAATRSTTWFDNPSRGQATQRSIGCAKFPCKLSRRGRPGRIGLAVSLTGHLWVRGAASRYSDFIQRERPVVSAKSHGCTSGGSSPNSLRMAQICSR